MHKAFMRFLARVCRGFYPRRQTVCPVVSASTVLFVIMAPGSVCGHQAGAPFSGAIIEPLEVHHAHIENEQRLIFSYFDGLSEEGGAKRGAFASIVELGAVWTSNFNFGSEVFIPFSNTGDVKDRYDIGDVEVWPIKYALINTPETVLTGVLSFKLPTGDESQGLGEGNTAVGGSLLFDQAYQNWYWGVNTEVATNISQKSGTEAEIASVISYSFIRGTGDGMAPPRPAQAIVPELSLELIYESIVEGEDDGHRVFSVLPGVHLWHPASDWGIGLGVQVPVNSDKDFDAAVLFQIRNHLPWGEFFGMH